mgnify:CR=1 FL=1|jgi:hypothetical protein
MAFRKNKKFIDPRYFMDEKTDVIKENDQGGTFTYHVVEDEFDGGPRVDIEGVDKTFAQMMQDLDGKEIDDDDPEAAETFTFTLDLFRKSERDEEGDLFDNIIVGGQAGFFIEAWAETNGLEAERTGGYF